MSVECCLTFSELCEWLHLGQTKVRELVRSGEIPAIRHGRALRFLQEDVREFIRSNRTPADTSSK